MSGRLRWMGFGMLAGAGGTIWAGRRLRRRVERYLPAQLRSDVAARLRAAGSDLRYALDDGRAAMSEREAELRVQLHLAPPPREPSPGTAATTTAATAGPAGGSGGRSEVPAAEEHLEPAVGNDPGARRGRSRRAGRPGLRVVGDSHDDPPAGSRTAGPPAGRGRTEPPLERPAPDNRPAGGRRGDPPVGGPR